MCLASGSSAHCATGSIRGLPWKPIDPGELCGVAERMVHSHFTEISQSRNGLWPPCLHHLSGFVWMPPSRSPRAHSDNRECADHTEAETYGREQYLTCFGLAWWKPVSCMATCAAGPGISAYSWMLGGPS